MGIVSAPKLPPETVERLRSVVQDWGREVTGAQQRLQEEIRAAATELSQIEDLLVKRLAMTNGTTADEVAALRRENAGLREALAQRDARIQELIERLAAHSRT